MSSLELLPVIVFGVAVWFNSDSLWIHQTFPNTHQNISLDYNSSLTHSLFVSALCEGTTCILRKPRLSGLSLTSPKFYPKYRLTRLWRLSLDSTCALCASSCCSLSTQIQLSFKRLQPSHCLLSLSSASLSSTSLWESRLCSRVHWNTKWQALRVTRLVLQCQYDSRAASGFLV